MIYLNIFTSVQPKHLDKENYQHKSKCNNGHTQKLYTTIRENGGWDNWRMVIIEECGEISLTQARIKEEENRMKLKANMNMRKCYRTEEEKKNIINNTTKQTKNKKKNTKTIQRSKQRKNERI
jgi:hypothetical protein